MSNTVEEKAEKLVDEVEEPLRERKEKAVEDAREAESDDSVDQSSVQFNSPRIVGGERVDNFSGDKVKLYLSESLPDGTDHFWVPMPDEDEVMDDSHKLNRLLNLYNIDVDRIGDINNHRLPLVPKGDYDDPENVSYDIDYPPVPTIPNYLIYKTRRAAMRLKLVKLRYTPKIRTDMFGDVSDIEFNDSPGGNVPSMPTSFYQYFRTLDMESREETFVLSERGILTAFLSIWLIPTIVAFGFSNSLIMNILMSMLFLLLSAAIHDKFVEERYGRFKKYVKENYFPDP